MALGNGQYTHLSIDGNDQKWSFSIQLSGFKTNLLNFTNHLFPAKGTWFQNGTLLKIGIFIINAIGPTWFDNPTYFPEGWDENISRKEVLDNEVTLRRLGKQFDKGIIVHEEVRMDYKNR